jgi:two-component system, NarL family, sensor kinase
MAKIIVFFCSCLFCLQLQAQSSSVVDSLKRNIDSHTHQDTLRAKAIYQYLRATMYNSSNNEPYIAEMLALSKDINFPYGIRKAWSMYVKYYGDRGDFQQSFAYGDSLLHYAKNDSSYSAQRDIGILYWDMANNYDYMGDYYKTIEYRLLAIRVFEKYNDKNKLCSLYAGLASAYTHIGDTAKSSQYVEKAMVIAEASTDDDVKSTALMNYANDLLNKKQLSKAETVLIKLEPIIQRLQSNAHSQYFFFMKGNLDLLRKNFSAAIPYLKKSLQLARAEDNVHQITSVMSLMFDCFNGMNKFPEAKIYLDSTLLLANKAGLKYRRKEVYDGYAVWHEKKGDYSKANEYLKRSTALNDSIVTEENNKRNASLEMRYQISSKETEIKNLTVEKNLQELTIQQKNILNYILIGAAITILAISLLSYRNYKQKQILQQRRITELETEKQLMATEAVLKGEEQERSRLAKDLHDGLGGMLSGIKYSFNTMKENLVMTPENHQAFERSMDMLDSSIKEMRRVAHNMMPESLVRFGLDTALNDFCNDINQSGALQVRYQSIGLTDAPLDQTTSITLYRVVQELLHNTLKHAGAKTAIVQVTKTNNQLSVTVEDDGKGFDTAITKAVKGIGWSNIRHRVDFLKGRLDVDSAPGKGTSVHIELDI